MTVSYEFDFDIGQEIKIMPIGMVGVVDSISVDINGRQYRVVYWNDGCRYSQWLYKWEIENGNKANGR